MASAAHCSRTGFNFSCFVVLILVVAVCTNVSPVSAAEEFKVGDMNGWRQPDINHTEFYTLWAATKSFHVGDLLREFVSAMIIKVSILLHFILMYLKFCYKTRF